MKTRMRSITIVLFQTALLFFSFSHKVQAATCTWNGSSGNWNQAANWSCGYVPGVGDEAVISSGSVNMTADAVVGELTLSGGTLTGAFNLSANTIVWSSGTMSGSGATTATSAVDFTGAANLYLYDRTFNNAGTANWNKTSYLNMNAAAIFNNQAGATFNIQTSGTYVVYFQGTFNNFGTLNLTTGNIRVTTFRQEAGGITNLAIRGTTPATDYSQLNASDFYLTGLFNISFTGGYTPQVGDHFVLLWYNTSKTGDFSPVRIEYVSGINWYLVYEGNTLHLWAWSYIFLPMLWK